MQVENSCSCMRKYCVLAMTNSFATKGSGICFSMTYMWIRTHIYHYIWHSYSHKCS